MFASVVGFLTLRERSYAAMVKWSRRWILRHDAYDWDRHDGPVDADGLDAVVSANVRALRARRRERQDDVAAAAGWRRPTLSAIEAGNRRVSLEDAVRLCHALEVDLRQLLAGADPDVLRTLGLDE
jgi:DNA-binding XRE family transcriptional regulator